MSLNKLNARNKNISLYNMFFNLFIRNHKKEDKKFNIQINIRVHTYATY